METNVRRLQRQQMVLKFLGYYSGKCDGIWSAKTIAAKRDFELSGKFGPAYPNNGAPFDFTSKLPKGLTLDWNAPRAGLIHHIDIPDGYYDQFKNELVTVTETFDPQAIHAPVYDPLMNETISMQDAPKVEREQQVIKPTEVATVESVLGNLAPAEIPELSSEISEDKQVDVEKPTNTQANQHNKHQNHQHKQRPR